MVYEIIVGGPGGRKFGGKTGGSHAGWSSEKAEGDRWACRLDGRPSKSMRSFRGETFYRCYQWTSLRDQARADRDRSPYVGGQRPLRGRVARSALACDRGNIAGADEKGPRKILAPMPGRVVRLLVAENSAVEVGQGIVVVEAMKMQNEIKSPKKGNCQKNIGDRRRSSKSRRRAGHRGIRK